MTSRGRRTSMHAQKKKNELDSIYSRYIHHHSIKPTYIYTNSIHHSKLSLSNSYYYIVVIIIIINKATTKKNIHIIRNNNNQQKS